MSNPERRVLEDLAAGRLTVDEARERLRNLSLRRVGEIALIDVERQRRSGLPEVIYGLKKTADDLVQIASSMLESSGFALVTRINREKLARIVAAFPDDVVQTWEYNDHNTVLIHRTDWRPESCSERIAVLTAGTSDIPYANETLAISKVMGVETVRFFDVGVAGIHRLIDPLRTIAESNVAAVVVFAGMEGALPTIVASLVDVPVIGVPVPTGYGLGGDGVAALMAMLQSCAPGLSVVNIGNGVGAGAVACLIARVCASRREA